MYIENTAHLIDKGTDSDSIATLHTLSMTFNLFEFPLAH